MAAMKKELETILKDPTLPFDQALIKVDPDLKYSELMSGDQHLLGPEGDQDQLRRADRRGKWTAIRPVPITEYYGFEGFHALSEQIGKGKSRIRDSEFEIPNSSGVTPRRRWLDSTIMDDGSASVFCFTPLRVPVSELGRLAVCPPAQPASTAPVCSAPPLPEGPCPVCPRLEQEFEPWRPGRLLGDHACAGPSMRGPSPGRIDRLQALLRLREQQLFGERPSRRGDRPAGPGRALLRHAAAAAARPAARPTRPKTPRLFPSPGRRRGPRSPDRPMPLLAVRAALRRLLGHRGFCHPRDRRPRPSPGHPPPTLSAHLCLWR